MAKKKAKPKARVKTKKPIRPMTIDEAVDAAMKILAWEGAMTQKEAVEFYGRVIDRCQTNMEALEEEIEHAAD
jgi:hypothetical protein